MWKDWKLNEHDWFSWKNPPWNPPWGKIPHGNPPWGVYRVLNIAERNSKMWMVRFLDLSKAFINFFTACENIKNWMSTINSSKKSPMEIPHGEIPHGEKVK